VCSVPRCGSSLLCDVLSGTELAGAPTEYFDENQMRAFEREWGVSGFDEYLAALRAKKTSPNGVFGVKAHFHQLRDALSGRDLDAELPGLRLVYVRRRDHVRQAVSWARADQTGQWASDHPDRGIVPRYDHAEVVGLLERIEREELEWEGLFERRGQAPLRIDYEELAPAPGAAVIRVLDHLGVATAPGFEPPAPTIAKQADDLTEEWVRRYRERVA
jgi:LPS sulfotransferase NodH